jgi:hypothetical protein
MRIRIFSILGLILGLLILVSATLNAPSAALDGYRDAERQARQQDKSVASNSQQPCSNPLVRIDAPDRVLQAGEAEQITIQVTNVDTIECDITVGLVAPDFALQPADNQQLVRLVPAASASIRWTVRAKDTGTATLAVATGNASQQVGVAVISGNGFFPPQRATINYVGIFLGALLVIASLLPWAFPRSRQASVQRAPSVPVAATSPSVPAPNVTPPPPEA